MELKSLAKSLANKIMRRVSGQQELVAAQSVLDEATTVDRVVEVEEGQLPSKKPSKPHIVWKSHRQAWTERLNGKKIL